MPSEIPFIRALDALPSHRLRSASPDPVDAAALHEVFQKSTTKALLEGVYDESITYSELRRHGGFGLGTFNANPPPQMLTYPGRAAPAGWIGSRR